MRAVTCTRVFTRQITLPSYRVWARAFIVRGPRPPCERQSVPFAASPIALSLFLTSSFRLLDFFFLESLVTVHGVGHSRSSHRFPSAAEHSSLFTPVSKQVLGSWLDLTVPYLFGISSGSGCSIGPPFDINCDTSFNPPKAFTSEGIGTGAQDFRSGCVAYCSDSGQLRQEYCSGIGCCQTSILRGLKTILISTDSLSNHTELLSFNRCGYSSHGEKDSYVFRVFDLSDPHVWDTAAVAVVDMWEIHISSQAAKISMNATVIPAL
ncbi:Serine threonine kinase [Olea europaea subsp. europaea]|uniref:Serine threonine kinase n=1 Tax=Olea europaea subsp. europaea TaxID=158383 RepID=A0A8S0SS21_OLEEU|nr:Serine threonine kinase [Olea europaea subsp. europaea]